MKRLIFSNPFKKFQRHKTFWEKVSDEMQYEKKMIEPEIRELLIGRKTVFSAISFVVGGVLIGNTAWRLFSVAFGPIWTAVIGFALFVIGGAIHKQFYR